jgi:hypothetical protein
MRRKYANLSNDAINFVLVGRRLQLPEQEQNDLIEKFTKYLEEQARLRVSQQFNQIHKHHPAPQEITGPGFSFIMPPITNKGNMVRGNSERIQFAIPPFDSRYYETSDDDVVQDYAEENLSVPNEIAAGESDLPTESKNKILSVPPPMHVNHEIDKILHRAQQKQARTQAPPEVVQKPMQVEFDNTMSLYIVALIAGLSCAFSTGVSNMKSRVSHVLTSNFLLSVVDCSRNHVLDALQEIQIRWESMFLVLSRHSRLTLRLFWFSFS